jgi:hypothetical protein
LILSGLSGVKWCLQNERIAFNGEIVNHKVIKGFTRTPGWIVPDIILVNIESALSPCGLLLKILWSVSDVEVTMAE